MDHIICWVILLIEVFLFGLLSKRLQNKEIAERLFNSSTTVKTHLQNIYQKLCVEEHRRAVDKGKTFSIL